VRIFQRWLPLPRDHFRTHAPVEEDTEDFVGQAHVSLVSNAGRAD